MLEYWNNGVVMQQKGVNGLVPAGKKKIDLHPFFQPTFPSFQYAIIPMRKPAGIL